MKNPSSDSGRAGMSLSGMGGLIWSHAKKSLAKALPYPDVGSAVDRMARGDGAGSAPWVLERAMAKSPSTMMSLMLAALAEDPGPSAQGAERLGRFFRLAVERQLVGEEKNWMEMCFVISCSLAPSLLRVEQLGSLSSPTRVGEQEPLPRPRALSVGANVALRELASGLDACVARAAKESAALDDECMEVARKAWVAVARSCEKAQLEMASVEPATLEALFASPCAARSCFGDEPMWPAGAAAWEALQIHASAQEAPGKAGKAARL